MKKFAHLIFFAVVSFALASCDSKRLYEENKDVPDGKWAAKDKMDFEFSVPDTSTYYNVFINVRNASQYQFSNIYLFVTTTYPDGKTSRDTLDCTLQDASGKWMGKGVGDLWDNQLLFKPSVKFPQAGKYKIEYEQAMRVDPLPYITDVGLRVERVQ
ncbi:MAG TPA: gliding motility lipoprotein GldH [Bacteroidia bacterium]